jgi:hypothetical protein
MTMRTKTIRPSSSYQVVLPEEVSQKSDDRVSSYWVAGEPVLLQLSSYIRDAGEQTEATQRLRERIAKSPATWNIWKSVLNRDPNVDQAIGEMTDEGGLTWVHIYLVWPHLTVYATISGPEDRVKDAKGWAYDAVQRLSLNLQ